jgi:hypothetical protein
MRGREGMNDDELYEYIREQVDEIGEPEGVVCCPEDVTDEQYERVMKRIEGDVSESVQ